MGAVALWLGACLLAGVVGFIGGWCTCEAYHRDDTGEAP